MRIEHDRSGTIGKPLGYVGGPDVKFEDLRLIPESAEERVFLIALDARKLNHNIDSMIPPDGGIICRFILS